MVNKTITAPKGFLAAGVACGVKQSGSLDLGIIYCPEGAAAAAMFTTNKITSAAVQVSKEHIESKKIHAVVVNSGNANACTGNRGIQNAITMCAETAKVLRLLRFARNDAIRTPKSLRLLTEDASRRTQYAPREVLVASTGIIGHRLPIDKVKRGIAKAADKLSASPAAGLDFAKAIMTTDTKVKQALCKVDISGVKVTIAGTVKGAGMIAPNMATTLCFITTDIAIKKSLLGRALKEAIGQSLNKLTVDGHQSTNDTAIILASGAAGNRPVTTTCPRYKKFASAVAELCTDLAKQMALDAEGATRMFTVIIKGAATKSDAAKAARAVADYDLVKCAIHGGDPNWGRIICAVGSSGVKLNLRKLSCKLDDLAVFKNGSPTNFDRRKAGKVVSQKSHTIIVDLGAGRYSDFCYGCDLSREYITINADYHT